MINLLELLGGPVATSLALVRLRGLRPLRAGQPKTTRRAARHLIAPVAAVRVAAVTPATTMAARRQRLPLEDRSRDEPVAFQVKASVRKKALQKQEPKTNDIGSTGRPAAAKGGFLPPLR